MTNSHPDPSDPDLMQTIVDARVIITCPGRNFVTLKITTKSGVHGLGDATLNGREPAAASASHGSRGPAVDRPRRAADRRHLAVLYRGAYRRRGPVTMTAIAATTPRCGTSKPRTRNMAALRPDRRAREPYRRDGRRPRQRQHLDETIAQAKKYKEMGYKGRSAVQSGVPAWRRPMVVSKDKLYYEPADAAKPDGNAWSTSKYPPTVPKFVCRRSCSCRGWDVHLLHDVHHRPTPPEAGRLGKDLEPVPSVLARGRNARGKSGWLPHDSPALDYSRWPCGEALNSVWDAKQLLRRTIDRLHPYNHRARRRDQPRPSDRSSRRVYQ